MFIPLMVPNLKKKVLKKKSCVGEISRSNLTRDKRFDFIVLRVAERYFYFASLNFVCADARCGGYSFGVLFSLESFARNESI